VPSNNVSNHQIPRICGILGALALGLPILTGGTSGNALDHITFSAILGGIGGGLGWLIGMVIDAIVRGGIALIVTIGVAILGFGGWYAYHAGHPTTVAQRQQQALKQNPQPGVFNSPLDGAFITPTRQATSLPETGGSQLAPPGVFYLLTPAHVETKDGIIGLPPGTRVTLVRPGIYLTPSGKVSLDETQLTNDLGKARAASANDRAAQAALRAKPQAAMRARPVDTIMENGTRKVPVQVNGNLTKNFVIDSGASTVALPSGVVNELMQTGTLTESDFRGNVVSIIADGSKSQHRCFILHSIRVGDTIVSDVVAIDAGPNGPLLLGMTFLTKAKAIYDTANGRLIFNP